MPDTENRDSLESASSNEATKQEDVSSPSDILVQARREFAEYDLNAIIHQRIFNRRQILILILGVVAVLLALTQAELVGTDPPLSKEGVATFKASIEEAESALPSLSGAERDSLQTVINTQKKAVQDTNLFQWFRYGIIVVPILISLLIAVSNKLKAGSKWILLRSAAESVKREIFLYRSSAGLYNPTSMKSGITRDIRLAEQLKSISDRLMKTVANEAGIARFDPEKESEDAMFVKTNEIATAKEYVEVRLEDQLNYFANRSDKMALHLKYLQWLIYISGGIGTFLAAIGLEIWVALSTALGTAFVTYLEYRQLENTLMLHNQVSSELRHVKNWWLALSPADRESAINKNLLVQQSEDILMNEQTGWVKNMTDALAQLQAKQEKEKEESLNPDTLLQQVKQLKADADSKQQAAQDMLEEMKNLLEKTDE